MSLPRSGDSGACTTPSRMLVYSRIGIRSRVPRKSSLLQGQPRIARGKHHGPRFAILFYVRVDLTRRFLEAARFEKITPLSRKFCGQVNISEIFSLVR